MDYQDLKFNNLTSSYFNNGGIDDDDDEDDEESSDDELGGTVMNNHQEIPAKKTKGRVKIKMEFIDNKLRRYTTFSKRKTGIMKKAYELSTLTGTQVMLLVASETGHVYTFATRKLQPMITSENGKALIQACLNSPDNSPTSSLNDLTGRNYSNNEPFFKGFDSISPSTANSTSNGSKTTQFLNDNNCTLNHIGNNNMMGNNGQISPLRYPASLNVVESTPESQRTAAVTLHNHTSNSTVNDQFKNTSCCTTDRSKMTANIAFTNGGKNTLTPENYLQYLHHHLKHNEESMSKEKMTSNDTNNSESGNISRSKNKNVSLINSTRQNALHFQQTDFDTTINTNGSNYNLVPDNMGCSNSPSHHNHIQQQNCKRLKSMISTPSQLLDNKIQQLHERKQHRSHIVKSNAAPITSTLNGIDRVNSPISLDKISTTATSTDLSTLYKKWTSQLSPPSLDNNSEQHVSSNDSNFAKSTTIKSGNNLTTAENAQRMLASLFGQTKETTNQSYTTNSNQSLSNMDLVINSRLSGGTSLYTRGAPFNMSS